MIARRSLVIVFSNFVGASLGFVALFFIARFLDKEAYGFFAYAMAIMGIAALPMGLGFPQAHVKRVSEGADEATANATFLLVKFVLTALMAFLVVAGMWAWTHVLGRTIEDTTPMIIFVVLCGYIVLSFRQFFDFTFQAHRQVARAESVVFIDTLVSVLLVALAADVWGASHGRPVPFPGLAAAFGIDRPLTHAEGGLLVALGYVGGRIVSLLFALFQFLYHRYPFGRPSRAMVRSYASFGATLAVVGGFSVIVQNIDQAFVGLFWTPADVANYSLSFRVLSPMLILVTALQTVMFPTISHLGNQGAHDEIAAAVRSTERYMGMLLVPQVVLAWTFTQEGLHILADQYLDAGNIVRILVVFYFFVALATPARSLVLGLGKTGILLRSAILSFVLVVGLNLLLVPKSLFGVPLLGLRGTGAALAAVVSALFTYVYFKHSTVDVTGLDYLPRGVGRQLVAGAILGGLLWGFKRVVSRTWFGRVWELGLVALVGFLVYLGILWLLRGFTKKDWDRLQDLLHPGKFARYVTGELRGADKQTK